ncbi:MAG: 30S ribosomal protein S17 [candidate division WOR-3 bacterium]
MRKRRKTLIGVVKSNRMQKTVVVLVESLQFHPKLKKYRRRHKKVYAHDEKGECKVGDKVLLMETRPLSKLKRWRVVKKL